MKTIYTILLSILFLSCTSDKLTNKIALQIIKNEFNANCIQSLSSKIYSHNENYNKRIKTFKKLESKGVVTLKTKWIGHGTGNYSEVEAIPTEKVKRELAVGYKFKVAATEIIEILGISVSKEANSAIVKFSYQLSPLSLFELRKTKFSEKYNDCIQGIVEEEVKFIKYDTGWKMEQPKSRF